MYNIYKVSDLVKRDITVDRVKIIFNETQITFCFQTDDNPELFSEVEAVLISSYDPK